jgi:hypothetical protein
MNRAPVRIAFLILIGCQGSSGDSPKNEPAAPSHVGGKIEVHDLSGNVTARVTPGHPCRATVDSVELLVGGEPLIAQTGNVRWTGEDRGNGTTILKDSEIVARIVDDKPGELSLIDPQGIPMIRVLTQGDDVEVIDKQSAVVRHLTRSGKGVEVQPGPTVTGTDDRLLVAALTAIEAPPEVRALAACHRLFARQDEGKKQ